MNRKQRDKNRRTSRALAAHVRFVEDQKIVCPRCGGRGNHYTPAGGMMGFEWPESWSCEPKDPQ